MMRPSRVPLSVILILLSSTLRASTLTLTAHDDGYATPPAAITRQTGWQSISDLEVVGDIAFIAWYDHGPPTARGMISRVGPDGARLDSIGRPAGGFSTKLVPEGDGVRLFHVDLDGQERVVWSGFVARDGAVDQEEEVIRLPLEPATGGFDVGQNALGMNLVVTGPYAILLDGTDIVRQVTLNGWGTTRLTAFDGGWVISWIASGGFAMWEAFDDELHPLDAPVAVSSDVSAIDLASDGDSVLYAVSGQIGLDVWKIDPALRESERIVDLDIAYVYPVLTRTGVSHRLSWYVNGRIEGAEIANDAIGQAEVLVPDGGFDFVMKEWQGGLLVADSRGSCFRRICEFDVYATLRTFAGETITELISTRTAQQTRPSLTRDGDTFLSAWMQQGFDFQPILAWGETSGSEMFDIHTFDPDTYTATSPEAGAWNGHRIVLWSSVLSTLESALVGFVLDETGVPSAPVSIPIAGEAQALAIQGWNGGWLATWNEWNAGEGRIAAMRIAFDGTPIGEELTIGSAPDAPELHLGVSLANDAIAVSWVARDEENAGLWNLRTARVTSSGEVLPGNDLAQSQSLILHPSVSCDGIRCLLVWTDDANLDGDYDIVARTFDASGMTATSNPFTIAATPLVEASPLVSWTGRAWVVTWTERDPDSSEATVRATRIEGRVTEALDTIAVGPVSCTDYANHALACGLSGCVSLRVLIVDDPTRGGTTQLMKSRIHESRRHGVRRDE